MKPIASLALLCAAVVAQIDNNVHVPKKCNATFLPASDTVLYKVPYTYKQVLTIIEDFKNLTWYGVPDDDVLLNGTDNRPHTARFYALDGVSVVETLEFYSRPCFYGPFVEVRSLHCSRRRISLTQRHDTNRFTTLHLSRTVATMSVLTFLTMQQWRPQSATAEQHS